MCDNETYDALSLWKVFDQTFFPKPLGRNFSEFARALEEFVDEVLASDNATGRLDN